MSPAPGVLFEGVGSGYGVATLEIEMLLFCHGLEGTPNGYKIRQLRERGIEIVAPEFRPLDLAARVELLIRFSAGFASPVPLVGSSYGGLTAAIVAMRHPERFSSLCLLAPALGFAEPPNDDPDALVTTLPTTIIHGTDDTVVPYTWSESFAARNTGVELIAVADGHPLSQSIDVIERVVRGMLASG